MLQGLARGSTPLPAHRLPRHTNKTLQAYCQAYCRPPSLAISRHLAHAHSLACSKGSHGVRLPGRLIDSRYTPTKRSKLLPPTLACHLALFLWLPLLPPLSPSLHLPIHVQHHTPAARGSTPRPAHRLPRHTNKTLQTTAAHPRLPLQASWHCLAIHQMMTTIPTSTMVLAVVTWVLATLM